MVKRFNQNIGIVIFIAFILIAGSGILKSKATIYNDCTRISEAGIKTSYSPTITADAGQIWGANSPLSAGKQGYDYALLVTNMPERATVKSAQVQLKIVSVINSINAMHVGETRIVGVDYGVCQNNIIFAYVGTPQVGWVNNQGNGADGYYDITYQIQFEEPVPIATPTSTPTPVPIFTPPYAPSSPTPQPTPMPQSRSVYNYSATIFILGILVAIIFVLYSRKKKKGKKR